LDALELDAAVLRDGRDTGREASGERREHGLDGGRSVVFGGEGLGVVTLEHEGLLVLVLLAETREALDGLAGVRAADPLRGRLPGELCGLGGLTQSVTGAQERVAVDSVVDGCGVGHGVSSLG